jgi:hypothetical protein
LLLCRSFDKIDFTAHTIIECMTTELPFEKQQPASQAMLQALMKQLVRRSKSNGLDPWLLQLLPLVPLMHAEDYADLMQLAEEAGATWLNRYSGCAHVATIALLHSRQ